MSKRRIVQSRQLELVQQAHQLLLESCDEVLMLCESARLPIYHPAYFLHKQLTTQAFTMYQLIIAVGKAP